MNLCLEAGFVAGSDGLLRRREDVLRGVLAFVPEPEDEPLPWVEVVGMAAARGMAVKTIENVLHEAVRFGAVYRRGERHGRGGDTREVRFTFLGQRWFDEYLEQLAGGGEGVVSA